MSTSVIDFDVVDPRFIDAVFPEFPEFVLGDLSPEAAEEREALCAAMPTYEDAFPPIPSSEWVEISRETERQNAGIEWLIKRIFDQSSEGSCVYNMLGQQIEICQAKQFGLDNVIPVSPISGYQQNARSASSGSTVNGALAYGKSKGLVPLDTPENRQLFGEAVMPHTGFRARRPAGADESALNFRIDESFVIRTYEGLVSAGLRGDTSGVGRQGHSICYLRPTFKTSSVNSLMYPYVNSWRESWGFAMAGFKGGFGADTPRQVQMSAGWAFAVTSVVVPTFRHKK
jgi:hypothetical protein